MTLKKLFHIGSILKWFIYIAPLLIFCFIFITLLNKGFPYIGHDQLTWIPYLIEGKWHFLHQGFSPLFWAPHLCGGWPLYGDPNDLFYSITQLLSFFLDTWLAINISIVAYIIFGYIGWFKFGKIIIHLDRFWSHVFALVCVSHGFYFSHILVGHLNFLTFPLIGWIWLLLFDPRPTNFIKKIYIFASFGLLSGLILYAGGYFVLPFAAIGAILFAPALLVGMFSAETITIRRLLFRGILFLIASVTVCFSKIVAVLYFLRFFDRTVGWAQFEKGTSVLSYIFKALFFVPQNSDLFHGVPWDIWEQSLLISPLVLLGVFLLPYLYRRITQAQKRTRIVLMGLYLIALLCILMELLPGEGIFADILKNLPVLEQYRVITRLLYIFSFPFIIIGIWALYQTQKIRKKNGRGLIVFYCAIVTIGTFFVGYSSSLDEFALQENYTNFKNHMESTQSEGKFMLPVTMVDNGFYNFAGVSSMECYSTFFVIKNNYTSQILKPGPVLTTQNGYYNLMNPACLQFPEENACKPLDRIAVADKENLIHFTSGEPTTWKVSRLQRIGNYVSMYSVSIFLLILIGLPLLNILASIIIRLRLRFIKKNKKGKH